MKNGAWRASQTTPVRARGIQSQDLYRQTSRLVTLQILHSTSGFWSLPIGAEYQNKTAFLILMEKFKVHV
jgi:hypothetical protein